jgi:iron(III) transport system ATP-binding protein
MEPQLLLLDEPLSNLDAKLREAMRFELKRLQRELRITTVYVTHDQSEALALSHSIAVMSEGRIQQIGSPREIYDRPRNRFVADFVGTTNFIDGEILAGGRVRTGIGDLEIAAGEELREGDHVVLSVRPEDVELSEARPEGQNVREGRVDQKVFLGEYNDFQVKLGERVLLSRCHPSLRTRVGEPIFVRLRAEKCVAFKV